MGWGVATLDRQNRSADSIVLPDDRLRITRRYDIANNHLGNDPARLLAEVWLPWGTADDEFTNCRLTKQVITGQSDQPYRKPVEEPPFLTRVFEEIPANDRVMVGEPGVSYDQYGRKIVVIDYIQFSAGTSVYSDVVGSTVAPAPYTDTVLKSLDSSNDGTLITSKLTFIDAGVLSDTEELKFGGKLKLRTIRALNEVPSTPAGYTLVTESTEFVEGLPVYAYGFAAGGGGGGTGTGGEISRDITYGQSIDQGVTEGTTVYTIQYLTDDSVVVNPISTPSGTQLIDVKYESETGYKLWTAKYAKGVGTVVLDTDIKNGGNLYIYHRVGLAASPTAPSPTIGGTVTLISSNVRNADGYEIYDYQWAEGNGIISSDTTYQQSSDEGTTGVTVMTIRQLSALSVGSSPITPPGGMALISIDYTDQDGYRLWTGRWASGTGTVDSSVEQKDGDTLVLYRIVALGAAASTPSATIGGTVNPTSESVREDNGYQVFTNTWAEGEGLNVDTATVSDSGALVLYRRRSYGTPPTTPSATIGGTVTLVEDTETQADGYTIYDYRWAEGDGQASISTEGQQDGALVYTVSTLNAGASTPSYPGSGTAYLISLTQTPQAGFFRNTAVYKKPPADVTYKKQVSWQMPGLASFTGTPPQLVISSPVTMTILADAEVTYDTSQITDDPFTVEAYCSMYYAYVEASSGLPVSATKAMGGYLAGASSISGTNDFFNGVLCESYEAVLISSIPSSRPTGTTIISVDNDPYITATNGTVVYRRTKVTYSF